MSKLKKSGQPKPPEHPSKDYPYQKRPVFMPEAGVEYLKKTLQSLEKKKRFWDNLGVGLGISFLSTLGIGAIGAVLVPLVSWSLRPLAYMIPITLGALGAEAACIVGTFTPEGRLEEQISAFKEDLSKYGKAPWNEFQREIGVRVRENCAKLKPSSQPDAVIQTSGNKYTPSIDRAVSVVVECAAEVEPKSRWKAAQSITRMAAHQRNLSPYCLRRLMSQVVSQAAGRRNAPVVS